METTKSSRKRQFVLFFKYLCDAEKDFLSKQFLKTASFSSSDNNKKRHEELKLNKKYLYYYWGEARTLKSSLPHYLENGSSRDAPVSDETHGEERRSLM